jgi:hypothetical protein
MKKKTKILLAIIVVVVVILFVWAVGSFLNVRTYRATSSMDYSVSSGYDEGMASLGGSSFGLSSGSSGSSRKAVSNRAPQQESITLSDDSEIDRLIIKTAKMSMVVEDVNESVAEVIEYAEKNGGFVVYSNVYKQGIAPYGEVSVKIPVDKLDQGVEDIKMMGDVKSQRVDGRDVTEEFVDLDAQISNLRAVERRYLDILNKAERIEDILAVERELTQTRSNIERIEGRMKYLQQSADLSTLTVNMSTDPDVLPAVDETDKWKPWSVIKGSFRNLQGTFKVVANFVIWMVVYIPLWIVIGIVGWLGRKGYRKWSGKNKESQKTKKQENNY